MDDGHFVHVFGALRFFASRQIGPQGPPVQGPLVQGPICPESFVLAVLQTWTTFPLKGMDQRWVCWLVGVERSPKRPRQPPMTTQTLDAHQVRSFSPFLNIGLGNLTRKGPKDCPSLIWWPKLKLIWGPGSKTLKENVQNVSHSKYTSGSFQKAKEVCRRHNRTDVSMFESQATCKYSLDVSFA